ncbi:MAG: hypothetical protein ACMG51_03520 [Ginsengibacter sp.]
MIKKDNRCDPATIGLYRGSGRKETWRGNIAPFESLKPLKPFEPLKRIEPFEPLELLEPLVLFTILFFIFTP